MPLLLTITHHSFCLLMADNLQSDLLTDGVLLGSVGNNKMKSQLTEQLRKTVKPSYDLKRCGEVLEQIMDPWMEELLVCKEEPFEMVLTGFYSNARTGEITLRSGHGRLNELIYPLRGVNEYLFTFISPDPSLYQKSELLLELPDDDPTTLENYIEHCMSAVYPAIYTLYPNGVHRVGELLALEKGRPPLKRPLFHKLSIDVSDTLSLLPCRKDLEQLLFSSQEE